MTDEPLREQFNRAFHREPDLIVRSPGRVNLIGEHTDYNDGWALPMALDLGTDVAVGRRGDGMLRVTAPRLTAADETPMDDLRPRQGPEWARYVRGTAALLREAGCRVPGADVLIGGNLPIGAGLSSSASLELAVAVAFAGLAGHSIDGIALARLGQRVENDIIGVRSGIMDQLAVALGAAGHALRIDCRSLQTEHVPIPSGARVLVLDSAEIDTLAEIAVRAPGVFGARLTGAGFGGCVVALAAADSADFALSAIVERYGQVTGLPGTGFAAAASGGTHIRWTAGQ